MAIKKKGVNKKAILAVMLLALIVIGVGAAAVFSNQKHPLVTAKVGVNVGDTFTYSLSGISSGPVPSTINPDFSIYNDTSYYKVIVTAINGTSVALDTNWVFRNGTNVESPQTINLASGILSDLSGFYPLYPSDMNANQTIYPHVYRDVIVNGTSPEPYASGQRETNYYTLENLFYNTQDPTGSTQVSTYDQVYFDRQTGMLTSLVDIKDYNNPELSTEVIWTLTDTNVWQI